MKTLTRHSIPYTPSPQPLSANLLKEYLRQELVRIADALASLQDGHMEASAEAPPRPRPGDIRYADGSHWNPGSGEGLYMFKSDSAWHLLG